MLRLMGIPDADVLGKLKLGVAVEGVDHVEMVSALCFLITELINGGLNRVQVTEKQIMRHLRREDLFHLQSTLVDIIGDGMPQIKEKYAGREAREPEQGDLNDNLVAWYFYTASVTLGRCDGDAWDMSPRQIWMLYEEHINHEAFIAGIRSGAYAPAKTKKSTAHRKATRDEF